MALPLRAALRSAGRFIVSNPSQMFNMARHALGLRVAVPLDAIRWFITNTPPGKKAPQDVTIATRPPAVAVGATIDLMGTTVRAGASIRVEQIEVGEDKFRVTLKINDVTMKVLGESFSPVAGLIKSGALDLSKPGNLVKFMPKRPPVLAEAHDDILVLDLMQNPKFAANDRIRKVLGAVTPVLQVASMTTEGDFLVLQLRASPFGIPKALGAARALASGY
ncbi:MAG TPA: hypothetical protein PLF40_19750 [Kofleriaceae bacterium]|jgi:hypothetical protein|nr:hypothetical protein [Kofleriaceae bacterium]